MAKNTIKKGWIIRAAEWKLKVLDFLSPLAMVGLRIWIGLIFWNSGVNKFTGWDSTLFLFEQEYQTHKHLTIFGFEIFTPESAAFMATFSELFFPLLLFVGFWARGAAFILLIMTAVIEFTYQSFDQHITWAIVLGAILLNGAGRFSWDYFIRANFFGFPKEHKDSDKLAAAFTTVLLSIFAVYLLFKDVITA